MSRKSTDERLFDFADRSNETEEDYSGRSRGHISDALSRFVRSGTSLIAFSLIALIILFSVIAPLFIDRQENAIDTYYSKKGPRITLTADTVGLICGGRVKSMRSKALIKTVGIGIGATENSNVNYMDLPYQPLKAVRSSSGTENTVYKVRVDSYLEVGFVYKTLEQEEYLDILEFEKREGIQVLYPLIEGDKYGRGDPNLWYKCDKDENPLRTLGNGEYEIIEFSDYIPLEENYMKKNGEYVYKSYVGGGNFDTAQLRVRVLYYNYYKYKNGEYPTYLFGTDSQGYDLTLRVAGGIRLSLLIAILVSAINVVIGCAMGAVSGFFGSSVDLLTQRVTDIISGVPFVVVATIFQIHLASRVGVVPSLLFAFVLTGWITLSLRVRAQFLRVRSEEYVLASRTLGASNLRLIFKHIFPNIIGTVLTTAAIMIPGVIFGESMLSYLGIVNLGGSEMSSLGTLLAEAGSIWTNYPHLMLFPASIISILMVCFNLIAGGLRDAMNPTMKNQV